MTAPGDSVLLIALLAVLMACLGYSIGRLHQRHQHAPERAEAYREGYDTAARSVFSMAARVAGPRRSKGAVRASAAIPDPGAPPDELGFPAPPPHVGPGMPTPAAAGGLSYSPFPDPRWSAPSDSGPRARHAAESGPDRSAGSGRRGRHMAPEEPTTVALPPNRVPRPRRFG